MLKFNRSKIFPFFLFIVFFVCISSANETLNDQLIKASKNGNLSQVETIIKQGADVNAKNTSGETVLMQASEYGSLKVVRYLVGTL